MIEIQRILIAFAVVALAAAPVAWLRTRGYIRLSGAGPAGRRPRRLEPLDRLPLSAQHSLHLVRMDKRIVLLGRSPSGITLLGTEAWHDDTGENVR